MQTLGGNGSNNQGFYHPYGRPGFNSQLLAPALHWRGVNQWMGALWSNKHMPSQFNSARMFLCREGTWYSTRFSLSLLLEHILFSLCLLPPEASQIAKMHMGFQSFTAPPQFNCFIQVTVSWTPLQSSLFCPILLSSLSYCLPPGFRWIKAFLGTHPEP